MSNLFPNATFVFGHDSAGCEELHKNSWPEFSTIVNAPVASTSAAASNPTPITKPIGSKTNSYKEEVPGSQPQPNVQVQTQVQQKYKVIFNVVQNDSGGQQPILSVTGKSDLLKDGSIVNAFFSIAGLDSSKNEKLSETALFNSVMQNLHFAIASKYVEGLSAQFYTILSGTTYEIKVQPVTLDVPVTPCTQYLYEWRN